MGAWVLEVGTRNLSSSARPFCREGANACPDQLLGDGGEVYARRRGQNTGQSAPPPIAKGEFSSSNLAVLEVAGLPVQAQGPRSQSGIQCVLSSLVTPSFP